MESESESHSVLPNSSQPHGLYSPWNSPGQNTGMGSLSLLQGIFPTQGSNPGLPHCRWILYQLSYEGSSFGGEGGFSHLQNNSGNVYVYHLLSSRCFWKQLKQKMQGEGLVSCHRRWIDPTPRNSWSLLPTSCLCWSMMTGRTGMLALDLLA